MFNTSIPLDEQEKNNSLNQIEDNKKGIGNCQGTALSRYQRSQHGFISVLVQ